jgi:two-component system sensor histidine kinase ChvG
VPEENLDTIFQRFYTSRPKGAAFGSNSGLGLSIARQIVTAYRGRLWAENRKGPSGETLGARFVVALPEPRPDARS